MSPLPLYFVLNLGFQACYASLLPELHPQAITTVFFILQATFILAFINSTHVGNLLCLFLPIQFWSVLKGPAYVHVLPGHLYYAYILRHLPSVPVSQLLPAGPNSLVYQGQQVPPEYATDQVLSVFLVSC